MSNYISNYFRFKNQGMGSTHGVMLYSYAGDLFVKDNFYRGFWFLPDSTQSAILSKLTSLIDLGFQQWKFGLNSGYYTICSDNIVEVYEFYLPIETMNWSEFALLLDEEAFEQEMLRLKKDAIMVLQKFYKREV